MQVRHLFSPQHAVRAIQVFKSRNWTQLEFVNFLESISKHGPLSQLESPALKMLYAHLPSITDPLIRYACLEMLPPTSDQEYIPFIGASYLNSEDVELTSNLPISSNANNIELVSKLIDYGAQNIRPISRDTWARLFESCVHSENFERARALWNSKPSDGIFIGEPSLLRFVELIGRYKDNGLLKSVLQGTKHELPLTSGTLAACLTCFSNDFVLLVEHVKENDRFLESHVIFQDLRFVSETLVPHVKQICDIEEQQRETKKDKISPLLGNMLLEGLYRKCTSQTVLHFYRYLVNNQSFVPNRVTAQILANTAYRLGNSKLLSYEIWQEMSSHSIQLDRKFYETTIICQLVGSNYLSVRFFLAEMARQGIAVRKHIQRMVYNKFERLGNTLPFMDIGKPNLKLKFKQFDLEEAASESPHVEQARSNNDLFIYGRSPQEEPLAVLLKMLAFDENRTAKQRLRA